MTRINTNVSSLVAQKTLARSNTDLQSALTRLSTGLRINAGKDDPAGLIASEALRSDIISVEKAITNSERANQLISTADSALGQVSQLLNDIRGLVSEAANTGALSTEQVNANQLQIDSSLEAIDRIAQITSFQGKRLLDGNLDFITQGVDDSSISGLQIDQANFGTQNSIGVEVNVVTQATKGQLTFGFGAVASAVTLEVGGSNGTEAFNFAAGSTITEIASAVNLVSDATGVAADVAQQATQGAITVSSLGLDNDIQLTADQAGFDAGNLRVKFSAGNSSATTVNYTPSSGSTAGSIDVQLRTLASQFAAGDINDNSIQTKAALNVVSGGANNDLTFTATNAGAGGNDIKIEIVDNGNTNEGVSFNQATNTLTVDVSTGGTSANRVIELLNGDATASGFVTASLASTEANTGAGNVATAAAANLAGGKGDINNDLTITAKLAGEQFNNTNVNVVAGNATAAGISSLNRNASFAFTSNSATLTFTAKQSGTAGNDINIITTSADLTGGAETVTVSGNTITINLDTDAANAGANATTGADIATLINNDVNASALVSAVASGTASNDASAYINDGENLNNGQRAQTSITTGSTVIDLQAKTDGPAGDFQLVVTENAGGRQVTVVGNVITVDLDSGGNDTAAQIKTALEGNAEAARLVNVSIEGATSTNFNGVTGTNTSTRGALQAEYVEYSADAQKARASVTFAGAAGGVSNNDFIIEATTAGSAFNDLSVVLQTSAAVATATPTAAYDANTNVLTLTINNGAATNVSDIKTAIEGVQLNAQQAFTVAFDDSAGDGDGTGTIDGSALGTITAGDEVGNTANTGAEAGTLFLYVEEGVSTANNVISQLANAAGNGTGLTAANEDNLTKRAAELFSITSAADNDGTGKLFATTNASTLSGGVTGGGIAADANEVIAAINVTTGLSDVITASLASGNDGKNVAVSAFQDFASVGSASTNNLVQFLANDNPANLRLVAGAANSVLSLTDNRGFASSVKDSAAANSSLVFTATQKGSDLDGVRVVFVDDDKITKGNEVIVYDADNKVLKFSVATGNTTGNNTTAADIKAALAADDLASQSFAAADFGTSDGTGAIDADLVQADVTLGFNTNADQIRIRSNAYGTDGNNIQVVVADSTTGTSISFANNTLTVNIAVASTTVEELAQQINTALGGTFTAEVVSTAGGAIAAVTATNLTGGLGADADANAIPDTSAGDILTSGGRGDTLIVNLASDANGLVTTTASDLLAFFDDPANSLLTDNFGISVSNGAGSDGSGILSATSSDLAFSTTGVTSVDQQASGTSIAVNGDTARVSVTAVQQGAAFDNVSIVYVNDDSITAGNETAVYDGATKTLTVNIDQGLTNADQVISAINTSLSSQFTASNGGANGNGLVTTTDSLTLTGGVVESGTVQGAAFVGNADQADVGLTFTSTSFGTEAFVSVKALSGTFALTDSTGAASARNTGTDVNARINGIQAIGRGLKATINTSSLDLSFSVAQSVTDNQQFNFSIVGGGALFQLGPDVVSNQQARLGIQSVSTATLGGVNGRLFELRSGGAKALDTNVSGAAAVVDEVITVVTSLRGRLGAFQKTSLESNIFTLNDTLANLTEAESAIRDADFAAESAKLTRAQILVQSSTSVLSIANSNPQNVLALLR